MNLEIIISSNFILVHFKKFCPPQKSVGGSWSGYGGKVAWILVVVGTGGH